MARWHGRTHALADYVAAEMVAGSKVEQRGALVLVTSRTGEVVTVVAHDARHSRDIIEDARAAIAADVFLAGRR